MKVVQHSLAVAAAATLAVAAAIAAPAHANADAMHNTAMHKTVVVGGAAMYPTRNIIQNAVHSKDHTTLVAAVKAAGLVDTLSGPGPFTVFAPTNEAFVALPAGTVDNLLKPENKVVLTKVLTYHVVPGKLSATQVLALIKRGGGKAAVKTAEGDSLIFTKDAEGVAITDDKGDVAHVTIADVNQSNGMIHVIDKVLLP